MFTIIVLLCVLVAVQGYQARPRAATRWEYTIIAPDDVTLAMQLNRLGALGWEVVAARRATSAGGYTASYELILKRPAP